MVFSLRKKEEDIILPIKIVQINMKVKKDRTLQIKYGIKEAIFWTGETKLIEYINGKRGNYNKSQKIFMLHHITQKQRFKSHQIFSPPLVDINHKYTSCKIV